MADQLNLFAPPEPEAIYAVLTHDWQDLDALSASSGVKWNPWTAATRLVREYRAQHRVIDGLDHYRLPTKDQA